MDQLAAMRVFVSVATLGSFAGAARRMRLSPSAVTRSIAQLEDHLAQTVLARTTRSVRLTERGRLYLASCKQLLDDLDRAEREVRGESAAPAGELVVAAPLVFGRLHVLPIVNGLLAAHRALAVRLTLSDRVAALVDEGIDVAIRIGELADSSAIAVRLGAVSRVVVASPAYLRARGTPRSPAEVAGHDVISFDPAEATSEWRFRAGDPTVRVASRLAVNSVDAALVAAEDGRGLTRVLSYQVRDAVAAGRLALVLAAFAPPPLPVSAVYPARRIGSPNVAAFVAAARAYFAAHPIAPAAPALSRPARSRAARRARTG